MYLAWEDWVLRLQRGVAWLPEWANVLVIVGGFVLSAWLIHHLVFFALRRAVRRSSDPFWRTVVERARFKLRVLALIIGLALGVYASPLDTEPSVQVRQWLTFGAVLVAGWLATGVLDVWSTLHLRRFRLDVEDNLIARKHVTQTRILQRVATILIAVVALGFALMTIAGFRQWGVSLLASAGAASIIAGLALQPLLTNLIAGVQIALTQPIRIDDAVIVEGEWGQIEEITSTYVVVRLWDWRRMVLPLTYFIQRPFQNWTRETSSLIGTVMLYVDYAAPVEAMRSKLTELAHASPLWDGQVVSLQVTDATERTMQVRCLVSGRNAPQTFDLRCEIREAMLAFLRDEHPEALPTDRLEVGAGMKASRSPRGEKVAMSSGHQEMQP